jgi:hypothetical protein
MDEFLDDVKLSIKTQVKILAIANINGIKSILWSHSENGRKPTPLVEGFSLIVDVASRIQGGQGSKERLGWSFHLAP